MERFLTFCGFVISIIEIFAIRNTTFLITEATEKAQAKMESINALILSSKQLSIAKEVRDAFFAEDYEQLAFRIESMKDSIDNQDICDNLITIGFILSQITKGKKTIKANDKKFIEDVLKQCELFYTTKKTDGFNELKK